MALHPFSPLGRRQPDVAWAAVQAAGPVWRDQVTGMWLVTGYELCRQVLSGKGFSAASGQRQRARDDELPRTMLSTDGLDHRRLRDPATGAWSFRSVERHLPLIDRLIGEALDRLSDCQIDLVAEFCQPLALSVVAGAIGIPTPGLKAFGELAVAAGPNLDPLLRGAAAEQAAAAGGRLEEFLGEHRRLAAAHGEPTDLAGLPWDAALTDPERNALLALLVVGGVEPLAAAISATMWLLCRNPWALSAVAEEPELAAVAVEESIRLHSPIPFTARVATTEFCLDDDRIPAGDAVLAVFAAANRDPEVFPEPARFRLDRPPTPAHLGFGGGAHFCLGAPLVRLAAACAVAALAHRSPRLRLEGEVAWSDGSVPRRMRSLPVRR